MATLEQGKPYLFVHEADPRKGGGALEVLQLELQDVTLRERLFDGRRATVWHRIMAFQLVSLVQIAEDMLRLSPHQDPNLSLYIPGSLLEQSLVFTRPVVLYVSPHNPGAAGAAEELRSQFHGLRVTSFLPAAGAHPLGRVLRRALTSGPMEVGGNRESERASGAETGAAAGAGEAPSHFLLYLNEQTFTNGGAYAQEVRAARAVGLPMAMVHENDPARGGCELG
eukprot:5046647-Prymnesium_polylepis.1